MNPYPQINLPESNVNKVVDILIDRYRTAVDGSGNTVFVSVERGLAIPDQTIYVQQCPFIRIWENSFTGINTTIDFFDREWYFPLSIFVGFHALPDNSGLYPDVQEFRNRLVKFALKCIQMPESGDPNGINFRDYDFGWNFLPENVRGDHTTPMQSLGFNVSIAPPWYVTRLEVNMRCHNYP